jgi:hypothetical protein
MNILELSYALMRSNAALAARVGRALGLVYRTVAGYIGCADLKPDLGTESNPRKPPWRCQRRP